MKQEFRAITLKFKTITPVFIGSGEVLERGFHYTVEDNRILKYDEKVVIAQIAERGEFDFTHDENLTVDLLKIKIAGISPEIPGLFQYKVALSETVPAHKDKNKNSKAKKRVGEFVNSNGKFYIPGSTIKGCLNTLFKPTILSGKKITERFLIYDSDPLENGNFEVDDFDWFPYYSLLVLKKGSKFTITIPKPGILTKTNLEEQIRSYFKSQVENAKIKLRKNAENNQKNLTELDKFLKDNKDYNQMLVNLGYGGGGWFKMNKGAIPPTSANKGESPYKIHVGWCSVEIVEKT